ncbi:carbohydrate ABC transporter permease [Paenibacillus sp. strain BS8-2]
MRTIKPKWVRRENATAYAMLVPAIIPYLMFNLIPILWVVYLSFTEYEGFGTPSWVGLENYFVVWGDAFWWKSVVNTFIFAFGKLIIEIPLALVMAVILNRKLFGSNWFRAIIFLPHVTSMAVMGLIFFFLFRPFDGILNGLFLSLGLINAPFDYLGNSVSAMICVILVGVWHGMGLNMILFIAGLQTIPKDIYESAAMDGAGSMKQFTHITLPMLGNIIKIVVMLAIVFTLKSFDLIKVLTDGGPFGKTEVMFTYVFKYFFSNEYSSQYGYGSALGVTAAIIILLVSFVYFKLSRNLKSHH